MKEYNKLVRDRIPEIIEAAGEKPVVRVLGDEEYREQLLKKLEEEAREAWEARGDKKDLEKEVGDILEVIEAVVRAFDLDEGEIKKIKEERRKSRGGFEKKLFLERTE